jgi:hypothetical protein
MTGKAIVVGASRLAPCYKKAGKMPALQQPFKIRRFVTQIDISKKNVETLQTARLYKGSG